MGINQQIIDIIESHTDGSYYGLDGEPNLLAADIDSEAMAAQILGCIGPREVGWLFRRLTVASLPESVFTDDFDVKAVNKFMKELAK
jgi:hypothetical protein